MPRSYSLSGGAGQLITTDPDPLEMALKRAQLEELLQKPQTERAQLALQQMEQRRLAEQGARAGQIDTSRLELEKQKAIESGDIDRARLEAEKSRYGAEDRFHQGSLAEEVRYHKESASGEKEKTRANVLGDIMSHYAGREGIEGTGVPSGAVGAAAAALGFPELSKGFAEAGQKVATGKARALLPEYQKYTPEQRTKELAAQPEEIRAALTGLLGASQSGEQALTPTGPPPPRTVLDPEAQIFPNAPQRSFLAPQGSAISAMWPMLKKRIAPKGSGLEALIGR